MSTQTAREILTQHGVKFVKIPGSNVSVGWVEEFTPELCEKLLSKAKDHFQRNHLLTKRTAEEMADEFLFRWVGENAAPITFTEKDYNSNGQFRMQVAFDKKITFSGFVFLDCPHTMVGEDTAKQRKLPDQIHPEVHRMLQQMLGRKNMLKKRDESSIESLASSVMGHMTSWKYGRSLNKTGYPNINAARDMLSLYPHIMEVSHLVWEKKAGMFWATPAHVAFVTSVAAMADRDKAIEFATAVLTEGRHLEEDHILLKYVQELRKKVILNGSKKLRDIVLLGSVVKAWNAFYTGEPKRNYLHVPYNSGRKGKEGLPSKKHSGENLPRIEPVAFFKYDDSGCPQVRWSTKVAPAQETV